MEAQDTTETKEQMQLRLITDRLSQAKDTLKEARNEIFGLRNQNKLMSARLDMFDQMMLIFHTPPMYVGTRISRDIVSEIDEFLDS